MKLLSILKTLDYDALESIREFWEIQAPPFTEKGVSAKARYKKMVDYLYPRLQIEQYFTHAFNKLDKNEKDLIYFLTIHGGDLEKDEVVRRAMNSDSATLDALVSALLHKGFVFYEDLRHEKYGALMVGLPEPFLRYIDLPTYWEGYLGYFLKERSSQKLKMMIIDGLGIKPSPTKKHQQLLLIQRNLLNPDFLRKYIASLSASEKGIFETLMKRKGVCVYRDLLATGFQKRYDHSKADFVNNLLATSGLVFTAVPDPNKYNNLLMIPRDIYHIISNDYTRDNRTLNELDTASLVGEDAQPTVTLDNSNFLLRDIVIFCSYLNRNPVKTLANGGIGKNDLKKIIPYLSSHKTVKYVSFLALFCIIRKFILGVGGIWKVTANFSTWLQDSQQCYRDLYAFWLETNEWNEEYLDGDTLHAEVYPTNLVNIAEMRKLILRNIANIPHRKWVHFGSFVEGILPQVEINIPNRGSQLVMEKANRPNNLIVESILAETMFWMGIVSVGLNRQKDIVRLGARDFNIPQISQRKMKRKQQKGFEIEFYFKLTDLGRHILEKEDPLDPSRLFEKKARDSISPLKYEIKHFIVQPNLDVITPPDLYLPIFYELNVFSDIKNIDVMSTLSITRDSLREGMDKGLMGERVLEFLESACRPGLPETVRHLVNECSEKHGEVNIGYCGGYITVDDPILLEDLRSHRKIQCHIKDIVDQKVILLNPAVDVKKLSKELQHLGFMPKMDSERVHVTSDQKYHLTLSHDDMFNLIAALQFVQVVEQELGTNISEDRVATLIEHLKPDPATFFKISANSETVCNIFAKHFLSALKKKITSVTHKYKKQVTSLLATSMPKTPSKYSFGGPNPAIKAEDIRSMIDFAIEHEFKIEVQYLTAEKKTILEIIAPESINGEKVYAFCESKNNYGVFNLKRIGKSTLV